MTLDNMTGITKGSYTGGDLFCKSQLITCNRVKECNGVCPFEDALKHADQMQTMNEQHTVDHDKDWIIGCIKHDGFIKTDRFDKANQIILEALSADAVSREEYEEVKEEYINTVGAILAVISAPSCLKEVNDLIEPLKVVRCKDCIHWKADNEVFELGFCCVFPQKWVAETFFCADGERREE